MNMATSIEIARKTKKLNRKRKRMKDGKPPRSIKIILNLGKGLIERPKIQIRSKLLQPPPPNKSSEQAPFKANDNSFSLL